MSAKTVGLVAIGGMGSPMMAPDVANAGTRVHVLDLDRSASARRPVIGAEPKDSPWRGF